MKIFVVVSFALVACAAAASISSEYLPPVVENALPSHEYISPEEEHLEVGASLADDGYRYKVVRRNRLRHRNRRDVSELVPSHDYLPPTAEAADAIAIEAPIQEQTIIGSDGYRYKSVKRLRLRHRRDVSEIHPSSEYLPPAHEFEEVIVEAPIEDVVVKGAEDSVVLASDGYRYKTVRRLKHRRH